MSIANTFDYVVVGAGASGAALAAKLTEDGSRTVLLLEAGPVDKKTEVHIPAAFSALFRSELDWTGTTTPRPSHSSPTARFTGQEARCSVGHRRSTP
jgi:choline dehydrogenase